MGFACAAGKVANERGASSSAAPGWKEPAKDTKLRADEQAGRMGTDKPSKPVTGSGHEHADFGEDRDGLKNSDEGWRGAPRDKPQKPRVVPGDEKDDDKPRSI